MKTTLQQHLNYQKDPSLFMQEQWLALDVFETKKYKNLSPFEFQLDFIKTIHHVNNNIIVKSRQMHITSMISLYIAWYVLFNSNKQVAILSNSFDGGVNVLERVKVILKNYSVDDEKNGKVNNTYFHWEDDFIKNRTKELSLKNGCKINVFSPTPDAGRGYSIDFLYIDEAAFIKRFEYIYIALSMATMAKKDSKTIITSTPSDNSFFNKLYLNSEENNLNSIRLHWSLHPIYSNGIIEDRDKHSPYQYKNAWFDNLVKNRYRGNINQVEQELECVVKYDGQTTKVKTISLRVSDDLYKKIQCNLKERETASDYIRSLVEKDLKNYL